MRSRPRWGRTSIGDIMTTRRRFVQGVGLTALTLLANIRARSVAAQQLSGSRLIIGTGGGSWRDSVKALIGDKLATQGVMVDYLLGSPQSRIAQLIAARRKDAP